MHSRDEQRSRSAGLAPTEWTAAGYRLLSPRDPDAGGTWIACRDDGAILAVMNRNPEPAPDLRDRALRSRGLLLERLAGLPAAELASGLRELDASEYAPFRAFVVPPVATAGGPTVWAAEWTAGAPDQAASREGADRHPIITEHALPACWVSSGLGDSFVRDRLPLFEQLVAPDPTPEAQDAYHRHAWPERGVPSVLMSRRDARTVSITVAESFTARADVDLAGGSSGVAAGVAASMVYHPIDAGATESAPMIFGEPHFAHLVG